MHLLQEYFGLSSVPKLINCSQYLLKFISHKVHFNIPISFFNLMQLGNFSNKVLLYIFKQVLLFS